MKGGGLIEAAYAASILCPVVEQFQLSFEPQRHVYSVRELNAAIRTVIAAEFNEIWVNGEISGTRLANSGHYYFVLKEGESQIRCACFRMTARYLKFKPTDGISVSARGRIDVYEQRGEYQMLVEWMEPRGQGALHVAFDELKAKLLAEGLFEQSRKKTLPKLPSRIGIITSPSGAVIQDMLHILQRRFPGLHIRLYPAPVQGEGSVEAICKGIRYFSESQWAQVVVLARGGGSLEDLRSFNEEAVARAIVGSSIPVISAVGHETDYTIADFVSDLRAPTPSAAAELVVCTREQLLDRLVGCKKQLEQIMRLRLGVAARRVHALGTERAMRLLQGSIGRQGQRVDELERLMSDTLRRRLRLATAKHHDMQERLRRTDLRVRLADIRRRLELLERACVNAMALRVAQWRRRLEPMSGQLHQLSPLRVLDRGYAIVQDMDGHVLKDAELVEPLTRIRILLAKGRLHAQVTGEDQGS